MRRIRRLLNTLFSRQRPNRQNRIAWKRMRDVAIEDRPTVQMQAVNHLLHLEENYTTVPMKAVRPLASVQQTEPITVLNLTNHIKAVVVVQKEERKQ